MRKFKDTMTAVQFKDGGTWHARHTAAGSVKQARTMCGQLLSASVMRGRKHDVTATAKADAINCKRCLAQF